MVSCSNDSVPPGAELTLWPSSHSTTIVEKTGADGSCRFDESHYLDIPIVLHLNSSNGSAIGDATVNVYVDFAANTYSGLSVLALYDDRNHNGVVDGESELVSDIDDAIARVRTDTWTGSRTLLLRINLSCAFRGEIFAYTGGVTARSEISVVSEGVYLQETGSEEES